MNQNLEQFIKNSLNEQQQMAVCDKDGVMLVCAGAGSGKTRIITSRIAYLISHHFVDADSIVALTFTNKAAKEMKERVHKFLGSSDFKPYVGTFHSYCLRLLKTYGSLIGINNFNILDDDDQEKIVKSILSDFQVHKKVTPRTVLSAISRAKNDYTGTQNILSFFGYDTLLENVYNEYEKRKKESMCLDFDDLLLKSLDLFSKNPEFRSKLQNKVKHILIDEYQDTNKVQHALLKLMSVNQNGFALDSLCAVGDEDQSIYSWRGANVSNIVNFKKEYPETKLITVDRNYRSVLPILSLANSLISNNKFRNPKNLWSLKKATDRIRNISCGSGFQEAELISLFLKKEIESNEIAETAVLYRSHFQSRLIEEALIRYNIPYRIMGGLAFYQRLEIKDIIAYLKLINNSHDRISLLRIINVPSRGLGEKFEQNLKNIWASNPNFDFKQSIEKYFTEFTLNTKQKENLKNFVNIINELKQLNLETNIYSTVVKLIELTKYYNYLEDNFEEDESKAKKENVKELLNAIAFVQTNNANIVLSEFLEEVALLQDHTKAEESGISVKLMTLHSAKGLEFNTVVLCGLEDGILPSSQSIFDLERLEEERRLLYVGITRAKERLLITSAKQRYIFGQLNEQMPSRFLKELDLNFIKEADISFWPKYQIDFYLKTWL